QLNSGLKEKGFKADLISQTIYHSPLLYVDKAQGKGRYRFTLVTDLDGASLTPINDYERFRTRLAALGSTDRECMGKARQEQSILADWIFRDFETVACAFCRRPFARSALVVAHKKKRSHCADSERLDPYIVFPLC